MRRPTERRWVPWQNGVRRTTSHSTSTRPRSWWWITGDRAENTHPSPSTRHLWSGWAALSSSAFTSPRISHGLLTQMQCWRRHISVSSSWGGWGSLERAPESSDPSTPALWRASWPAASLPGLKTAPLATAGLCKGSCELPAHCWRWAFLPPGYLHQAVYKESPEDSFFPQAIRLMNSQKWPTLQHTPTHTTCHALHFNTVQLDYTHTLY